MKVIRISLPISILGIAIFLGWYLIATKPEPRQRPTRSIIPEVDVVVAKPKGYTVTLKSQGTVRARTQSALATEVRGRIISISPSFREGGFFEEDDILLKIDPSDYAMELTVAESTLVQRELEAEEQKARYEQAQLDLERLNLGAPSPLARREPYYQLAKARVAAAQSKVANARKNLERTRIRAPFAGRVLTKNVDVGQFVSQGIQLARIYAVDFAEVRLPLTESQLQYLDLDEVYRGENPDFPDGPMVMLKHTAARTTYQWEGRIVRAEGSIDTRSRQLFVIAQVRNPYGRTASKNPPLKVGTFVLAEITGKTLAEVFVLPRKLLKENQYVLTVDNENRLRRTNVQILWHNDEHIVVGEGITAGDRLNLTDLPLVLEGLPVLVKEQEDFSQKGDSSIDTNVIDPARDKPIMDRGHGSLVAHLMAKIPEDKPLPENIKQKLDEAVSKGDLQAIQLAMSEIGDWAKRQGINLSTERGQRPR